MRFVGWTFPSSFRLRITAACEDARRQVSTPSSKAFASEAWLGIAPPTASPTLTGSRTEVSLCTAHCETSCQHRPGGPVTNTLFVNLASRARRAATALPRIVYNGRDSTTPAGQRQGEPYGPKNRICHTSQLATGLGVGAATVGTTGVLPPGDMGTMGKSPGRERPPSSRAHCSTAASDVA